MRRLFRWEVSVLLLLAAMTAGAQVPGVTVTAKPFHSEPPLPKLSPDEFMSCERMAGLGAQLPQLWLLEQCELQMDW